MTRRLKPLSCVNPGCSKLRRVITMKNGGSRQLRFCSATCAKAYGLRSKESNPKFGNGVRPGRLAQLEANRRGFRVDWVGDCDCPENSEPVYWVERELAKVRLARKPYRHRCSVCLSQIYVYSHIIFPDGKRYCGEPCYNIRITDEMAKFRPNPEPSVYARMFGTKYQGKWAKQQANKADRNLHGGVESERKNKYNRE